MEIRMANNVEAIIFDLDGTMWNALEGIRKTWNQVVANHPEYRKEPISSEELEGCLGLPMTDIAGRLFSNTTAEQQQKLMEECCEVENAYLSEHGGILYPKLEETLTELKKSYKLFVVSNCQKGYIESFIKAHKLADYFDDIECWGNNLFSKGENNKLIMKRNGVTRAVYVGDTAGDEESARIAGIPFIFAKYGFGEAKSPDYVLEEFSQLPAVMEKI
ncbi:MAG: HAD family hydrolase [Lachnospiraceae bacterium]|nr:HAD family hydrolase [Lachnospiraceae bacterium]